MQVAVPARKFVRAQRRLQPARKKLRLMQNFLETIADRPSELVSGRSSDRFSELPISDYTKERLSSARFTTPTPVQAAAIPMALEGKDVLATADGNRQDAGVPDSNHRASPQAKYTGN